MELLEKYIDDPHRDEIVAREMGWCPSPGKRNRRLARRGRFFS
jgi:hypothetical protein